MDENLLKLLRNYLTNRKQKVKLFNTVSELQDINTGVPQGSIIGPVMFIVYINDLTKVLEYSNSLMYADDTVIYCGNSNNKRMRKLLQADLC